MKNNFRYHYINIFESLPKNWEAEIFESLKMAKYVSLKPTSVSSRESDDVTSIDTYIIDGNIIKNKINWLHNLYQTKIFELAQIYANEKISCATNDLYGINLNIQHGEEMRYECHVDTNPIQAVLYLSTHTEGCGGELVVSNNPSAIGTRQIDADCTVIYPIAGYVAIFNAQNHPHYVRALKNTGSTRISAPMNFYTKTNPETARPNDLNFHLFNYIKS